MLGLWIIPSVSGVMLVQEQGEMYFDRTDSVLCNVGILSLMQQRPYLVTPVNSMFDFVAQYFSVCIFWLLSYNLSFFPAPFVDVFLFVSFLLIFVRNLCFLFLEREQTASKPPSLATPLIGHKFEDLCCEAFWMIYKATKPQYNSLRITELMLQKELKHVLNFLATKRVPVGWTEI